jgi:hypothetical protein
VNGDLAIVGTAAGNTGNSTITGNLTYTNLNTTDTNHVTVQGTSSKVGLIALPNVDYASLRFQAGQTVNGNSTGQTFAFNTLGGNKVIWIKGDLTDPIVTIGGTYAAGGTFIVDGKVNFTGGSATLGADGYPVYIVSTNDITQTGGAVTLYGCLYTQGKLIHKTLTMNGAVYAGGGITNNASGQCTFNYIGIPWFDTRATMQTSATLPLYTTNHRGIGP